MIRPTATNTTNLADLLRRSSSSDIFTNYLYEPATSRVPLTFTPDDARATDEDGSGASTPPLWPHSSPDRDQAAARTLYSSLSPASRTQAIARGQMELMEMVKNMPESCYELSLQDLVEVNHRYGAAKTSPELRGGQVKRRSGAQQQMVRSSSNGGGFLLKMVVPVSWGTRKKKNSRECCVNGSASLRASAVSDKEWWSMKRGRGSVSVSVESDRSGDQSSLNSGSRKSSSSSSRSNSTNGSSSRRFEELSDCWSFIRTKKPNNP